MWGTSSPDGKLVGDFGKAIAGTRIGGRPSDRLIAGKSSPINLGLLQQYWHIAEEAQDSEFTSGFWIAADAERLCLAARLVSP
jgi:hypothetical protein